MCDLLHGMYGTYTSNYTETIPMYTLTSSAYMINLDAEFII